MTMRKFLLVLAAFIISVLASPYVTPASALATRTWVSGVGDDLNPCSRTAPCATFATALAATSPGGEINCLDSGGFGSVTITISVSIQCDNAEGGVLVSGTNGITINAGSGDVVFLSGLDLQGTGSGLNGISFTGGKALHVSNTTIRGFATNGINFAPAGVSASLVVQDSIIADNPNGATGGGILVKPGSGLTAKVTLTNVHMDRNLFGLRAEDGSKVTVSRSSALSNTNNGILAFSSSVAAEINVSDSVVANNGINGVVGSGAGATVRMVNVSVFDNGTGLNPSAGSTITSFSPATNASAGNTSAGAPNGVAIPQQ
jgi:hypothetical protein